MAAKNKGDKAIEKTNSVLERLQVEYVPVDSLRPNDYNPNRQSDHDFELLLRSMREDGFTQPIVAQREGIIVDGEHRWRAGQALGMEQVPVVFVDMSVEQMKIATLRHNRARGSEDIELASAVLRDLAQLGALDYAQDSLMLDDVEIQRLIEDVSAPDALAGDDYSESWEPTEEAGGQADDEVSAAAASTDTKTVETAAPGGGTQSQASSASAIEAARKRERELAVAKSEEERARIRSEAAAFYRLGLLFHGDEAALVKHVLGENAAEKLVEVVEHWVASHPEDAPPAKGDGADAQGGADDEDAKDPS